MCESWICRATCQLDYQWKTVPMKENRCGRYVRCCLHWKDKLCQMWNSPVSLPAAVAANDHDHRTSNYIYVCASSCHFPDINASFNGISHRFVRINDDLRSQICHSANRNSYFNSLNMMICIIEGRILLVQATIHVVQITRLLERERHLCCRNADVRSL